MGPKWDCSVSGGYVNYTISANNVTTPIKSTKKITDSLTVEYGSMYTSNPTTQTTVNTLINNLKTFARLDTTYNSLLKCEFVSDILSSISPGCNDTVDAVHMLWRGFIVTAVGYLCLWITMLVTISRMANADLMIDGGNFDAKMLVWCKLNDARDVFRQRDDASLARERSASTIFCLYESHPTVLYSTY